MNVAVAVNDMVVPRCSSSNSSGEYILQQQRDASGSAAAASTGDEELLVLSGAIRGSAAAERRAEGAAILASLQSRSMGRGSIAISNAAAQACAASSSSSDVNVVVVHSPLQLQPPVAAVAAATAEEEEEECTAPRPRWCPTPDQIRILESFFNAGTTTPSREMIVDIAAQLRKYGSIAEANVFYWFQNRKARAKRKRQQFGGGDCISPAAGAVKQPHSSSSASPMMPSKATVKAIDRLNNIQATTAASAVPPESSLPPTDATLRRSQKNKKKKKTASLPSAAIAASRSVVQVVPSTPTLTQYYSAAEMFEAAAMPLQTRLRCDVGNATTGMSESAPPPRRFGAGTTSLQLRGGGAGIIHVQRPPSPAPIPSGGGSHFLGSPPPLHLTPAASALLMQQQQQGTIAAAEAGYSASLSLWADRPASAAAAQDRQLMMMMERGEGQSQIWSPDDSEGSGACHSFLRATSQGLVLNIMSWDGKTSTMVQDMMNPSSASSAGFIFQEAAAPPTRRPLPSSSFSSPDPFIQSLHHQLPLSTSTPDQLLSQYSLPFNATAEGPKLSSISSSTWSLALPPAGTEDHLQLWEELGSSCGSLSTWREHQYRP